MIRAQINKEGSPQGAEKRTRTSASRNKLVITPSIQEILSETAAHNGTPAQLELAKAVEGYAHRELLRSVRVALSQTGRPELWRRMQLEEAPFRVEPDTDF